VETDPPNSFKNPLSAHPRAFLLPVSIYDGCSTQYKRKERVIRQRLLGQECDGCTYWQGKQCLFQPSIPLDLPSREGNLSKTIILALANSRGVERSLSSPSVSHPLGSDRFVKNQAYGPDHPEASRQGAAPGAFFALGCPWRRLGKGCLHPSLKLKMDRESYRKCPWPNPLKPPAWPVYDSVPPPGCSEGTGIDRTWSRKDPSSTTLQKRHV